MVPSEIYWGREVTSFLLPLPSLSIGELFLSNNSVTIIYGIQKLWPETVGPVSGTDKAQAAAATRVRQAGEERGWTPV